MNNNPRRQQKDIAQEKNLHHKTNAQRPSAIFVSLMRDWREFNTKAHGLNMDSWKMEYLGGAHRPLSEKYLFREEDVA